MKDKEEKNYLQKAIDKAHEGKTPFGAVIVLRDKVLAVVFNTVSQSKDPTVNAEVNAIREACQSTPSTILNNAELYTTCEPCPMYMSVALYAGIKEVVCGASIPLISQYLPQIMLLTF